MLRAVLWPVLLFLLPFVGYAVWLWLNKKAHVSDSWRKGPMAWLTLAGITLAIVGLVMFATQQRAPDGAEYRPAHMRDGVFVPGRYE